MSKRLQVVLPDKEMAEIQRIARRAQVSVGEWVRSALREARTRKLVNGEETKLRAVGRAAEHSFPTADVPQMLAEIERGSY